MSQEATGTGLVSGWLHEAVSRPRKQHENQLDEGSSNVNTDAEVENMWRLTYMENLPLWTHEKNWELCHRPFIRSSWRRLLELTVEKTHVTTQPLNPAIISLRCIAWTNKSHLGFRLKCHLEKAKQCGAASVSIFMSLHSFTRRKSDWIGQAYWTEHPRREREKPRSSHLPCHKMAKQH